MQNFWLTSLNSSQFDSSFKSLHTRHIKRYGDYVMNEQNIPQPFGDTIHLSPQISKT